MSTETHLGPYLLGERVGTSVWLAEDKGEPVALKVLTRELPADPEEREAMVREVRSSAALFHTFLVPVREVAEIDDTLVLLMERVTAQPLSRRLKGAAAAPPESFHLACQLASVLKYLHSRQIVHANINSDSVMLSTEGKVLLGGLNLTNLVRRGRSPHAFLQKRADLRSVAYMAPEQVTTGEVDARSDIYSLGVILYEMATGCLPHSGRSAAEIALAIAQNPPVSPLAVNPAIPHALLTTIGRCLFKDPEKRFVDAKAVHEFIQQAHPDSVDFAAHFERIPAEESDRPNRPVLLFAELADHAALRAEDPERAARASARMHMLLGETVNLFDGRVLDALGTRVVAELPNVESALEAARKAEFEVTSDQSLPPVRLLLHSGEVDVVNGEPAGPVVEKANQILGELPPDQLFISEEFLREGRGNVRMRDAGARGGMKLFTIVPAEVEEPAESDSGIPPAEREEPSATTQPVSERAAAPRAPSNRSLFVAAAAVVGVILLLILGFLWLRRESGGGPSAQSSAVSPAAESAIPPAPQGVFVAPFVVESGDAEMVERANAMRLAAIAILRGQHDIRVVDAETPGAVVVSASLQNGPGTMEIVTRRDDRRDEPRAVEDSASGVLAVLEAATLESRAAPNPAERSAINAFVEATRARAAGEPQQTERALRQSIAADPSFLPAQLMAMEFFASAGREADAAAAARQIVSLDPANLEATRRVARASLIAGDLRQAFALFAIVLERNPRDAEALNHYARYALAAGDDARFTALLRRIEPLPALQVGVHEPDRLAAAGRIDAAVKGYYEIEDKTPSNAALALKIGRLAVLRHSLPVAEIQLAKLEKLDPLYGYHLLNAYIAAEKGDRALAVRELEAALETATPGDDSWTSAAEVYTILADTRRTLESLDRAAKRKEPTAAYVIANPLFRYLSNEARFQKVRSTFIDQQAEIRAALQSLQ